MPYLDVDQTARITKRIVNTHVRTSDPGTCWIVSVFVTEDPLYDKDLFSTPMGMWLKPRAWRPSNKCNMLGTKLVQWQHLQPRYQALPECHLFGVNDHSIGVSTIKLMDFNEDLTALIRKCVMRRSRWISYISSLGISSMFIRENPGQN